MRTAVAEPPDIRPIVVDTATVAAFLGTTAGKVRVLVHRGVITPAGQAPRRGRGGRPSHLFDLHQVQEQLLDTPHWPGASASSG